MKKCIKCSAIVNDTDRFCTNCGGAEFSFEYSDNNYQNSQAPNAAYAQTSILNSRANVQNTAPTMAPNVSNMAPNVPNMAPNVPNMTPNVPNMTPNAPGAAPNSVYNAQPTQVNTYTAQMPIVQPKKKKTGMIIGIVCAVVALLIVIGIIGSGSGDSGDYSDDYGYADDYDYDFDSDFDVDSDYGESISYTEGSIVDGVYVNEWADLSFDLSAGWVEGSQEDYDGINNSIVTCGLFAEKSGETITISYADTEEENMSAASLESFLDDYVTGMTSPLDNHVISESEYKMVGDYSYLCADLEGEASGYKIYFTTCMRELDGYLIMITVAGSSKAENYSTLEEITSCTTY